MHICQKHLCPRQLYPRGWFNIITRLYMWWTLDLNLFIIQDRLLHTPYTEPIEEEEEEEEEASECQSRRISMSLFSLLCFSSDISRSFIRHWSSSPVTLRVFKGIIKYYNAKHLQGRIRWHYQHKHALHISSLHRIILFQYNWNPRVQRGM